MTVGARISTYPFDPQNDTHADLSEEKRAIWTAALQEESGHIGELRLETGDGRQIVIHLWESEDAAQAASAAHNPRLRARIKEQIEPNHNTLWVSPPQHQMAKVLTNTIETP